MIGRRAVLLGGTAVAAVAAGTTGTVFVGESARIRAVLRRAVGSSLARSTAADQFIDALLAADTTDASVFDVHYLRYLFFTSTTAMAAYETGEEAEFLGLFDRTRGCSNGLSAAFAPGLAA